MLTGGWHFKPHWFAELSYADLGGAEVSNVNPNINNIETISYKIPTVHIGYFLRDPEEHFNLYAKLGVSAIANKVSSTTVPFEEQTSAQLTGSLGAQWRSQQSGLFARAQADFYDRDALSLGLMVGYYFGKTREQIKTRETIEKIDDVPGFEVIEYTQEITQDPVVVKDSDDDGIADIADQCPDSSPGVAVDARGCKIVNEPVCESYTLEGVTFQTASSILTAKAKYYLTDVVHKILESSCQITLVGHTDSRGSATRNKQLSYNRAKSVFLYLNALGVEKNRMKYVGMGENNPRASNETAEGRKLNRRVEVQQQ